MVAKEPFLDPLPRIPILKQRMRWLVLCREDQSHFKLIASLGSHFDLGERKILDAHYAKTLTRIGINITEPGPSKFVRRRPCGEDALAGISHRQKAAGFRMHHDRSEEHT